MNETTLIPLQTFTGETITVEEAFPQGVVATPGGTPTTTFEDLLAGLLITQIDVTATITDTPTDAILDPTQILPEDVVPTEVPLGQSIVNDQLVNFFNVTPSGVPLPSQRVSVSTTPTTEATRNPNQPPTPLTEETPLTQQEPITLEQIRIRARSVPPTTTNFENASPLPPVAVPLPNPDGTVLARPPEPDDVRARIPEIGAVAPSVTSLTTNLEASQQTIADAIEGTGAPRSAGSTVAPFALPDVPTEPYTAAVSASVASPVVIVAPTAATNLAPLTVPTASTLNVPAQTVSSPLPPKIVPLTTVTPANATTVSTVTPNTTTQPPQATPAASTSSTPTTNTVPAVVTSTPAASNGVAPTTLPVSPSTTPTAPATPIPPAANTIPAVETVAVSPTTQSTGTSVSGVVLPGVETNGYLPTFPRVTSPVVAQYPPKIGLVQQSERNTEFVSEVDVNSPTPLTNGQPTRIVDAPRTTGVESSQARSVVQQTADVLIREASLTQTPGESEFRLRLHPAELGEIRVHLRSTAEGVTAHLSVAEEGVRRMIESQLPDLRQRLADSGVTVNGFNVSTDSGSDRGRQSGSSPLEQPFEWERAARQQQQPTNRPPKTRPAASSVGLDVTA